MFRHHSSSYLLRNNCVLGLVLGSQKCSLLPLSNRILLVCANCVSLIVFLLFWENKTTEKHNTNKTSRLYMITGYKILDRWNKEMQSFVFCFGFYQHLGRRVE